MTMLERCIKAYNEFNENYYEGSYCIPDDGGFNYLSRLGDFTYHLFKNDLIKIHNHVENDIELKFENNKDAKTFFNMTSWLKGKDSHFTSCHVEVRLIDNVVTFIGYEW